jgi:hypothetical protein
LDKHGDVIDNYCDYEVITYTECPKVVVETRDCDDEEYDGKGDDYGKFLKFKWGKSKGGDGHGKDDDAKFPLAKGKGKNTSWNWNFDWTDDEDADYDFEIGGHFDKGCAIYIDGHLHYSDKRKKSWGDDWNSSDVIRFRCRLAPGPHRFELFGR